MGKNTKIIIGVVIGFFALVGLGYLVPTDGVEETQEQTQNQTSEETAEGVIRKALKDMGGNEITEIKINAANEMLVYITWNSEASQKTIHDSITKVRCPYLAKELDKFQEIAGATFFFKVPSLDGKSGKCAYERKGDKLVDSDMMFEF